MISVIIATRDRAALLRDTLAALAIQDDPGTPVEILVVDNRSIDNTREIVVDSAAALPWPVHYLYEPQSGKSYALNSALARVHGDILVFTDDDVLPARGWLKAFADALAETRADYAVGRIFPLWEAPPPAWMSPALYGVLAVPDGGTSRLRIDGGENHEIMPLGANMAVRRHVVDRVGGWNTTLGKLQGTLRTGEDHEFALRMTSAGFVGVYEPSASVQHRVPGERLQLSYFRRWFYDNGAIEASLEDRYPTTAKYLGKVPRHLWRQSLDDVLRLLLAAVTGDRRTAVARFMRLTWFAGYVRARWQPRPAIVDAPDARRRTAELT
jgi:glycosyltransferase involved in cell wall biosynthesis